MKLGFLLIIFLLISNVAFSDELQYQKLIETKLAKDDGYSATLKWFAVTFKSAKAVIQVSDKESGLISGNGAIPNVGFFNAFTLNFTLTIDLKDDKARMTFTQIAIPVTMCSGHDSGVLTTQEELNIYKSNLDDLVKAYTDYLSKYDPNW